MSNSLLFLFLKDNRGFKHYDGLKIIAAIGFLTAMAAPALIQYLEQQDAGPFSWVKFSVMLLITVLIVVSFLTLIIVLLNRDTGTKEERAAREQEERCSNLLSQALFACRSASSDAKGYQKTWERPKNPVVQQAIWGSLPVDNPERFEILFAAWNAGERDNELALQLMYASWDLEEQCYDISDKEYGYETLILGFQQPYEYLGGHQSENHTLLLTAGHMITLFFYRTGLTFNDAEMCLKRFLEKCPDGIPDAEFEDRGEFGRYFTHIIGHRNQH